MSVSDCSRERCERVDSQELALQLDDAISQTVLTVPMNPTPSVSGGMPRLGDGSGRTPLLQTTVVVIRGPPAEREVPQVLRARSNVLQFGA